MGHRPTPPHTSTHRQPDPRLLVNRFGQVGFWPKELWLPSSPDLNPWYFWVLATLEAGTNRVMHPNVA